MDNHQMEQLSTMVFAPYIQKASALIGVRRKVGGNQFRHCLATMIILIDYHHIDDILLKAAIIHDLFEDYPESSFADISQLAGAPEVFRLVREVSNIPQREKSVFLQGILEHGSREAKLLKCSDRISNLTDLHLDSIGKGKMEEVLTETEKYILPMAAQVDPNMEFELRDLVHRRRLYLESLSTSFWQKLRKLPFWALKRRKPLIFSQTALLNALLGGNINLV